MTTPSRRPPADVAALAALFLASGALHLVRPRLFEPIVPRVLPRRRDLVLWSGVAELACGAGLLVPSTRALAGTASAWLLVGVLPANVQMSVSFGRRAARTRRPVHILAFLATVGRLPLQWPLIQVALRARTSDYRAAVRPGAVTAQAVGLPRLVTRPSSPQSVVTGKTRRSA